MKSLLVRCPSLLHVARPIALQHRVSIVAGVLRNASWAGDPRCASLPQMLDHLRNAGYVRTFDCESLKR